MPQELRVVCCFQCQKFQSDIVKKAKKWTCKLCGAQQSLVKEYARGSGRECRLLVQQLSDGSLMQDQMERFVAEQVLLGEIDLPVLENPVRVESDRLIASHEANRKDDGNRGSKWDSFCVKDDAEDEVILTVNGNGKAACSSWNDSGNQVDHRKHFSEEPKHLFAFHRKNKSEKSASTSKLFPIADFHQMDKQEKQQFKWQSKNLNQSNSVAKSSSQPFETSRDDKKPLFNFKPTSSTLAVTHISEITNASYHEKNIAIKRTPEACDLTTSQQSIMSFAKKSKWSNFNKPELELIDHENPFQELENLPKKIQSPTSSSKWGKYIPQTDQEDDEFS